MGDELTERDGARPKFFTFGTIAVLLLLVLILVLALLRSVLIFSARKAVDRELAAARSAGYPTTLEELAPPPVAEEGNAAPLLEMAAAMLRRDADRDIWMWFSFPDNVPSTEEMRSALEKHAEPLRLAKEALRLPHYRLERDYDSGIDAYDSPNLVGNRCLTSLLLADALLKAREGRRQESIEALSEALDLAGRIGSDPMVISKMIGSAMASNAIPTIEMMNRDGLFDDEMRREILVCLERRGMVPAADTLFVAELAFVSAGAEDFFGARRLWGPPPSGVVNDKTFVGLFQFVYLNDVAQMIRSMRETAGACRMPSWEMLPAVNAIDASIASVPEWRRPISQYWFTGGAASLNALLSTRAQVDAARVGLALELHRSSSGDYPDSLSALVPGFLAGLPKDPFTGKDLIYNRAGDDVTVSSVGPDLVYNATSDQFIAWKTRRVPPKPRTSRRRPGRKRGGEGKADK